MTKKDLSQRINGQENLIDDFKNDKDSRFNNCLKNFLVNTLEIIECNLQLYTKGKSVNSNELTTADLEYSFQRANDMFEKYKDDINFCTCGYLNKLGDCIKQDIDSINNTSIIAQYNRLYDVIKSKSSQCSRQ